MGGRKTACPPKREKPRGSRSPLGVFSMRVPLRLPAHLAGRNPQMVSFLSTPARRPVPVHAFRRRCGPLPRYTQVRLPRSLSAVEPTPRGRLSPVRSPASSDGGEAIRCLTEMPAKGLVRFRGRTASFAAHREPLGDKYSVFARPTADTTVDLTTARPSARRPDSVGSQDNSVRSRAHGCAASAALRRLARAGSVGGTSHRVSRDAQRRWRNGCGHAVSPRCRIDGVSSRSRCRAASECRRRA